MNMTVTEQNTMLIEALKNIIYPVSYLQRKADKDENELNGVVSIELSKDSEFLKSIARDALEIAYCQITGSDTPHGLASCDDFKDWLKTVGV
jgi:hypothetical protein